MNLHTRGKMSGQHRERNRQALRSIASLQSALLELLEGKPYQKITITEIAERSGLTRSTFYAHFETKDDLLDSIINIVIDEFFEDLFQRDVLNPDPIQDLDINQNFFRVWQKYKHLIPLLYSVDFDCLLISRIRSFFEKHNERILRSKMPILSIQYTSFLSSFLAYAFVGFLKEWIRQGMEPSPEIMGEMLYHFTGPPALAEANRKFQDKI
jgi:AcrR family transcriptional regulator